MKYIYLILFLGFVFSFNDAYATGETSAEKNKKHKKKKKKDEPPHKGSAYIIAFPVVSSDPSFGLKYGVAGSFSVFLGDPKTTSISSNATSANFTTKKQMLIISRSTIYTEKNKFKVDLDWQYLKSSQATYGLGTGDFSRKLASNGFQINDEGAFSAPIPEEDMLKYRMVRLHQGVSYNVYKDIYLGVGYNLDYLYNYEDNLLNLDTVPPAITSFYAYNKKYGFKEDRSLLSGIALIGMYDTRDNVNVPWKGMYANFQFNINPTWLGSRKSSTSLWMEYRGYVPMAKNNKAILAFWTFANIQTSGNLPYMNLPALGSDQYSNSGRGYTQGRFRGFSMIYSEIEWRQNIFGFKKIPNFFGINFFANMTTASNKNADIYLFKYFEPAAGVGLRMMLSPDSRLTLKLDYAVGKYGSSGIYAGVNEYF